MNYSLGIDAGGTYTDAVILRNEDNTIIQSGKALTSYPDPLNGVKNSIDTLNPQYLKNVNVVSISTTLSTNTILEGTGSPVAMILIGDYEITQKIPTKYFIQVNGGHNQNGVESKILDIESIKEFIIQVKNKVSAFAISSYFSIRNHDHELITKQLILELTDLPVVCSHELSHDLGAFERAITAFLNAQLISITEKFMKTVKTEVESRGINAKVFMLKCDGSVISIKNAIKKPIESIFSGPAGSLVGASFLTKKETCAVIDVGGTSTDVSIIHNGVPDISESGAFVGGWKTKVKAIKMETSALGGDSHVWVKGNTINIGPRRVIPLCRAAMLYPDFHEQLKTNSMPTKTQININYQPTKFYLRTEYEIQDITEKEAKVLNAIKSQPTSITEIFNRNKSYPASDILDNLIQKRLIQPIGFTLTDALHVLGEYREWDFEVSNTGADLLGLVTGMNRCEFAKNVKMKFAKNMASNIVSFFFEEIDKKEIRKMFDIKSHAKFKLDIPIVMIGGPVTAFVSEMNEMLDAEIIIPEYSSVGNAAGALAAKGIRRFEAIIKPESILSPEWGFFVFSELGKNDFYEYEDALEYAISVGKNIVSDDLIYEGVDSSNIKIDVKKQEIIPKGWPNPMETKVVVMGIGER